MTTLAATTLLVAALGATAPGPPRFVVVPLVDAEVETIYAGLVAAGARVVAREDRRGVDLAAEGERANARVDDVRAALLEARARMRELDVDLAGAALNRARTLARELADPAAHLDLVADVLLERAGLLIARQAKEAAAGELRLLAALDPSREALHPGLYPPSLVEAYREARAAPAATGLLTVLPRPDEAKVFVDGRAVDPGSPLSLPVGAHWVSVRAPGRVTVTQEVKLTSSRPILLEPLAPVVDAQSARAAALIALKGGDDAALLTLKGLTGASALLGIDSEGTFVERDGARVRVRPAPGQTMASAALVALLQPEPPDLEPVPEPVDLLPWWIAGGTTAAVVAGAAIGVTVWYLAKPDVDLSVPRPVVVTCCSF